MYSGRNLFWFTKVAVFAQVFCNVTKESVVSTKIGTLIGQTEVVEFNGESRSVQRFLGIPYAKPPVGERRFARPEPFGIFSEPYNATFHRSHCLQTIPLYYLHLKDFQRSEDCLYLNVYVPGNVSSAENKHAVMLYIHGGSFALGGADIYSGDILATFNDVVVVTINHRLNVFGFLSNGTKSSGNFGLWDMRMALQWVHENIGAFGGDSDKVTLFGNSAGGAAVMYQAMYPGNKGLFQRVIAQSGSSFVFWAIQEKPYEYYRKYVSDVGCDVGDYDKIRGCLLEKSAEELQVNSWDFLPSVDRDFLWETPSDLFSEDSLYGEPVRKFFGEIDLMNGVTSSDGAMSISTWTELLKKQNIDINQGVPRVFFEDYYIPSSLRTVYEGVSNVTIKSVIHQYTDWSKPDDPEITRDKMIDLASDISFFIPAVKASMKHSNNDTKTNSYFYVFDHKPSFIPEPNWLEGATHTMEVAYIFGLHKSMERKLIDDLNAIDPLNVTADDIGLSNLLMTMWSNFAKSGNPNLPINPGTIYWPPYDNDAQRYIELSMEMTSESVKDHLAAPRVAFWNELFPVLRKCNSEQTEQTVSAATLVSLSLLNFIFVLSISMPLDVLHF